MLLQSDGSCSNSCLPGEFALNQRCLPCSPTCQTCESADRCLTCYDDTYLLDGKCITNCTAGMLILGDQCVDQCPTGYFTVRRVCKTCPKDKPSYDPLRDSCISCEAATPSYNPKTMVCEACPDNAFFNPMTLLCEDFTALNLSKIGSFNSLASYS